VRVHTTGVYSHSCSDAFQRHDPSEDLVLGVLRSITDATSVAGVTRGFRQLRQLATAAGVSSRVDRAVCRGLTLFCCSVLRFVAPSFESKAYSCTRRRFVGCFPNAVDASCECAAQRLCIAVYPCVEQCVRVCFNYKSKQRACNALCSAMVRQMTLENSLASPVAWSLL